ncbi:hypothetical protein ACS0TY_005787 [Phlomoides rotata]
MLYGRHRWTMAGMTKLNAVVQTLPDTNPDVVLESYTLSIMTVQGFETFMSSLHFVQIKKACNELNQTWMESGKQYMITTRWKNKMVLLFVL